MQAYESAPVYPGGADPRGGNSTVLSMSDFSNMEIMSRDVKYVNREAEKKAYLRKQSQNRYKNWGNTLEALREKKKRDRLSRLEQIEAAQRVIDQEEESYQEQQRRAAIDKANRVQFQDCERVKTFQTALGMANALKERQAQIMINRRKKVAAQKEEEMWFRIQQDNIKSQINREEEEELARQSKSKDIAREQLEQLAEVRARQKAARIEEILDGERNKKIALEAVEEAEEMERMRIIRMKENSKEYMRANIEQQKIKAERAKLEAMEEAKIEEFATEKERKLNLRREMEKERFDAKQARFEKMLKRQYDHLQNLRSNEANRVEKQVEEVKARDEELYRQEQARQARLIKETKESRNRMIERKAEEKERNRIEGEIMATEYERRKQMLDFIDSEKERKTRLNNVRTQTVLKAQMVEKRLRAREARIDSMEGARALAKQQEADDEIFMDYAQQCINDFAARGRTIVPMKLTLKKFENPPLA
mmetsp:Transcript_45609/g.89757  ORF Transcript_45609/g.89757 Transcript_45609/m.89757 type:complete len:480 (+) Transcript_45609:53-1492(+)|eukprot:CAMPEP_0175105730 /NCGR_PEP_ID=MMETSP0086_2-20121207/10678_1 /TAXON_ID=136419 /ORGANISM="Unknown Unknown, Strain D1" /LENGTH=479 /DNA_ID=CAMNT_0016381731 /DNA_START=58 /DNA_END=1497 /DNA_ORIENTATION=-